MVGCVLNQKAHSLHGFRTEFKFLFCSDLNVGSSRSFLTLEDPILSCRPLNPHLINPPSPQPPSPQPQVSHPPSSQPPSTHLRSIQLASVLSSFASVLVSILAN